MMQERLTLTEVGYLPVILPLRNLGQHLRSKHPDPGKDGPALLLRYLHEYFAAQEIVLPDDFFDEALEGGQAIILLDGMDEVADQTLRERIARLIEKFTVRYPEPRYVVTSRIVGYEGAARIGADFGLAKVRDFSPTEVRQFVRDWTRVVDTTLAGDDADEIVRLADAQAERLIAAIESNPRVADLAVNPLLLTVIALVHRYRANLPERRSELYEEPVEVLLGNWDAAKPGMQAQLNIGEIQLDSGDRRSLLEPVAFWMHTHRQQEIELDDLRPLLLPTFENLATNGPNAAQKAVDLFLRVINERSGMLIESGIGIYDFAHLTFQEYLAARALADHREALAFTLEKLPDPWWREVILLQAGYLSTQGKRRVSELIGAILNADTANEPEPHHHLLLAAECLFDVGLARVEGDLLGQARARLREQAEAPLEKGNKESVLQKVTAMNALARIESGQINSQFWKQPWGEPQWVTIPADEFWLGSEQITGDEKPIHWIHLPAFRISRVPVTNAQYALYVRDADAPAPEHWRGGEIPKGLANHPVVNVSWHNAVRYCRWLSEKTGLAVTLPSEAEWEKAARGPSMGLGSQREYPWGDNWQELRANTSELGLRETTPVGLFLNGASPYGVLDLSGNVWEWTRSVFKEYPYNLDDGREDPDVPDDVLRVVRGGSWADYDRHARCAYRYFRYPDYFNYLIGFRVVLSLADSGS
jgi:formylglycine-generating enzyme required for sulfatase activity